VDRREGEDRRRGERRGRTERTRAGDPFVFGGDPGAPEGSEGLPIAKGVAVLVAIGIVLLVWRYLATPAARIPP